MNETAWEHNLPGTAVETMDESFSYYLNTECPDKHIRDALCKLVEQRLSEPETGSGSGKEGQPDTVDGDVAGRLRFMIAVNPNTPAAVLDSLANCLNSELLERIAENPRTSAVTLARLAFEPDPRVREAVAENSNTPLETIWMLVRDENVDVRFRLSESYHVPQDVLQALTEDENPYVAARAMATIKRIERMANPPAIRRFRTLSGMRTGFQASASG